MALLDAVHRVWLEFVHCIVCCLIARSAFHPVTDDSASEMQKENIIWCGTC